MVTDTVRTTTISCQ